MDTKNLKLVLHKEFKTQKSCTTQEFHKALDELAYEYGCIAGWEMNRVDAGQILSYSCTTEYRENDVAYLHEWIKGQSFGENVDITDNIKTTGEIIVHIAEG